jgi:hypothetical protein
MGVEISPSEAELLSSENLDAIERSHPAYEPIMMRLLEEAFQEDSGAEIIQKGEVRDWLASLLD